MNNPTLADLGWSAHFRAQLSEAELADMSSARVTGLHRSRLDLLSPGGTHNAELPGDIAMGDLAVGDWVLTDTGGARVTRVLERRSVLARRAAGTGRAEQLIAANVDTLAIVTSCNADFNEARLERYLALAASGGVLPLFVLTKADLCDDPSSYRRRAERLSPLAAAVALDARDPAEVRALAGWSGPGQTLALVGSSGVGKTTLANHLTGRSDATGGIREDDAKGRHTTTARALWPIPDGGWLLDTPGMRALRLTGAAEGIGQVFEDLEDLAAECRFSDCSHNGEPGCAIEAAIAEGQVEDARLRRWQKLLREDARNSETLREARVRERATTRLHKTAKEKMRHRRRQDP